LKQNNLKLVSKVKGFWGGQDLTISAAFDPKDNAFGIMRVVLASLVILTHSFFLGDYGVDWMVRFSRGQESIGGLAVKGFFVLSGFLITRSFIGSKTVRQYISGRILRIMPGFWVSLLVVAFLFAPLTMFVITGSINGFYLSAENGPLDYIRNNFLLDMRQYDILAITSSLPWKNAFNGSLWTLIYEAWAYVIIGLLGFFGLLKDKSKIILLLTGGLFLMYIMRLGSPETVRLIFPALYDIQLVSLLLFFMVGSVFYLHRDLFAFSNRYVILSSLVLVVAARRGFYGVASPVLYSYIIMYLACRLPYFKNIDRKADYSYGIYIYAFPVQQLLSALKFNSNHYIIYSIVSLMVTLPFAVLSYHIVEKPALRLKNILK
jgi:peptidoglycan/LPS O-acetylase OafA/YrhL